MLLKTHLAIGLAVALYFSVHVNDPLLFVVVVLISTFLPEIGSNFPGFGKRAAFKPFQTTTKSRGVMHSYTAAIFFAIVLAFIYPVIALPFFIGYSFHIFADSFTSQGIRPFWPLKSISKGIAATGGKIDRAIFYTFLIIDIILIGTIVYTSI